VAQCDASAAIRKAAREEAGLSELRTTIGRWSLDLDSPEAKEIFQRIRTEGVAVFRRQPGFVGDRLMRADRHATIAVAEWESEALGTAGARNFRAWLAEVGIRDPLTMAATRSGEFSH
jgi:hypothetical protein